MSVPAAMVVCDVCHELKLIETREPFDVCETCAGKAIKENPYIPADYEERIKAVQRGRR